MENPSDNYIISLYHNNDFLCFTQSVKEKNVPFLEEGGSAPALPTG